MTNKYSKHTGIEMCRTARRQGFSQKISLSFLIRDTQVRTFNIRKWTLLVGQVKWLHIEVNRSQFKLRETAIKMKFYLQNLSGLINGFGHAVTIMMFID